MALGFTIEIVATRVFELRRSSQNVYGYDADPDLCGGFGTVWPDRGVVDDGQGE